MSAVTPSSIHALLVASLAASLGCTPADPDAPSRQLASYDQPLVIPAGVRHEGPALTTAEPIAVDSAEECGRARGIDADGNCVPLNLHELEFGGMVQIPAGAFVRGDIPVRYDARPGRELAHHEHSGQPMFPDQLPSYWIDGYEVARKAYAKCVSESGCTPAVCLDGTDGAPSETQLGDRELGSLPQTCVTHDQAANYCKWRGARLPNEAEWEYAARGPVGWIFPWGHQFRDELGVAMGPVGYDPLDTSYFGLKGFGGNAIEWIADEFEPDANIERYVGGEFRRKDGPLARAFAAWKLELCGGTECDLGKRYVVKGGRTGARAGAWNLPSGQTLAVVPERNFEGDRPTAQHLALGFRCANDLGPEQASLDVPAPATALPLYRVEAGYELLLVIAEAVDRDEAERFCKQLVAPGDPNPAPDGGNGWRLPSLAEIRDIVAWFGGPGPFWVADGAAEQTHVDEAGAEWGLVEAAETEPLMARCIRKR
jgi:formylglycine-generating enzyme required for sulfatase activity